MSTKLTDKTVLFASVLCLSFVISGCGLKSKSTENTALSSDTIKSTDSPVSKSVTVAFNSSVYFARSPSMETAEKELSECLFGVARQVSMRKKVLVRYTVSSEKETDGSTSKRTSVSLDFDQNNSMEILERLTVLDVTRTETGTEAQIQLDGETEFINPSVLINTDPGPGGNPVWVSQPPEGKKFYAAVGSISQVSKLTDPFTNADMNAIGALTPFVAKPVVSGKSSIFETEMHGVYIAGRWYNQAENRYYSLAILPR